MKPDFYDRFRLLSNNRPLAGEMRNRSTAIRKRDRMNLHARQSGKGNPYRIQGYRDGAPGTPRVWWDIV